MIKRELKSRLLQTSMFAGAVLAVTAYAPALAQEADAVETVTQVAGDEVARQQTITVTGSRIQSSNLTSAVPVSQFNAAEIELSGAVNVADVLRTLPATGVSSLTTTNSNFNVTTSGINTVELRNLTEDRTLVLVNGRRFVGGIPGTQVVDFNQIPTEFIERIDVITGGASAVYGSDALAGVVNVILKNDFEGVTASAQAGIADEGYYENYRASITAGANFDNNRGNAVASLGWATNNGAYFRDRPGQGVDDIDYSAFTGDVADFGTLYSELFGVPFLSGFGESGRMFAPGVGQQVFDVTTGTLRPYAATDGFNRQGQRAMSTPFERITFASALNYEINPLFNFFAEANYATTDTTSTLEPFPHESSDIYGSLAYCVGADDNASSATNPAVRCINGAPITGAYVPESFRDLVRAANPGIADEDLVYSYQRRLTEVDNRGATNTRQTARIVLGFDGEWDNGVRYETSLNWGRTTQSQLSTGQIDVRNFQQALNSEILGDGTIQCVDEIARNQGCVPINIWGLGAISPEAADYVRADVKFDAEVEQVVFNAYLAGDTSAVGFELPAGPVGWVIGYEWREESSRQIPDALSQSGLNGGNITPITIGDFNVYEFFGELRVPILESLTTNFAARNSTYSTVGDTFAWSAGAEWAPVEQLRLRAQYSEAVRAPNISESFAGLSETFATVSDPCDGVRLIGGTPGFASNNTADRQRIASNCYQDPLIAARIARDGSFDLSQPERQGTGGLIGGALVGGFDLQEEEATTYTFGFVFNPNYNSWLEPLVISVDYFNIEITDAISTLGRNLSLNRCYGNGDETVTSFDPNSAFCSNVERFDVGPYLGAADRVNSFSQNLAKIKTSGIDLQASYTWDLNGSFNRSNIGELAFTAAYQWLDTYDRTPFPGGDADDYAGTLGLPEHKGLFGAIYYNGPLTLSASTQWVGSSEEDFGFLNEPYEFDDAFFTDVQLRYRLLEDKLTLVAGVDNIENKFVYAGVGLQAPGHYTDPAVYDALGRRGYVGFRLDF